MKDLFDFAILAALYFVFFYKKWRARGNDVFLVNTAMYIYLSFVLYFTLMPIIFALPFIFNHPYIPMNMTPFIDVTYAHGDFTRQIALNIIMTIPFGFLLPLTHQINHARNPNLLLSFLRTIFFTFLLSLAIETLQPLLHLFRSSDITDLITNLLGGALGFLLYLIFRPLALKILRLLAPSPATPESELTDHPEERPQHPEA